jgi:putative hydrolase of the HAD superfamily
MSNCDNRLTTILDQLGLSAYFDAVLDSQTMQCAKPDPKFFQYGIRTLSIDIDTDRKWYIGDDLKKDYEAARQCGWHSLFLSRPGSDHPVPAEDIVHDLMEAIARIDNCQVG